MTVGILNRGSRFTRPIQSQKLGLPPRTSHRKQLTLILTLTRARRRTHADPARRLLHSKPIAAKAGALSQSGTEETPARVAMEQGGAT